MDAIIHRDDGRPLRVLVAGLGNIFLGDDGFGVEVAQRLRRAPPAGDVDVVDFGIRGIHLACELAGGKYDAAVLVDAVSRGGAAGTLYAIEPEDDEDVAGTPVADPHSLTPAAVLGWLRRMDSSCRVIVVGCEPASLQEGMHLSPVVAGAVDGAIEMVREVVSSLNGAPPCA